LLDASLQVPGVAAAVDSGLLVPVAGVALVLLGAVIGGYAAGRQQGGSMEMASVAAPPDDEVEVKAPPPPMPVRATGDLGACHNGKHLSAEAKAQLEEICALIGTPGKGITACDEGPGTIGARFEAVGVENTEENRRLYRQMLFEAPGCNEALSAAILDPETVYQKNDSGKPFPEALMEIGIVPGVKPHLKVYTLPGQDKSTVMQGLDSLAVRCREYAAAGCKFAKWRSPLTIDVEAGQPSDMVIQANMNDLARYALICQDEGLVPIVEPDISLVGDHDLETAVYINVKVQSTLYKAMLDHGVFMEGAILKSNMVNPGKDCPIPYSVEEIAQANIDVLRRCFPIALKSANFLSGGQSLEDAAARLSVINKIKGDSPWNLSFSWSAALQMPLFQLCKETGELQLEAMSALYSKELKVAAAAARGEYEVKGTDGAHVPK
jgi:fructose-bisphosphate aldolase class I